jgi:hypothetical protein
MQPNYARWYVDAKRKDLPKNYLNQIKMAYLYEGQLPTPTTGFTIIMHRFKPGLLKKA